MLKAERIQQLYFTWSPKLKPIEHVGNTFRRHYAARLIPLFIVRDLQIAILEIWKRMEKILINDVTESMEINHAEVLERKKKLNGLLSIREDQTPY